MQLIPLGEISEVKSGFAFKSDDYCNSGIPLVRIGNLNSNGLSFGDNSICLPTKITDAFSDYLLKENDVLIAMSGATTGKVALVSKKDLPSLLNQRVGRFTVKKDCLDPKYLFYFLSYNRIKDKILSVSGGSAQPNVSPAQLKELEIPLPDLKTQREIARILEEADLARQKRKAANALTDQFLQSTFLSLFGDPIENAKGWEVQRIRSFVNSIISGKSVQSEQRKKHAGEFGVLKVSAVTYGYFKPEEHKAITDDFVPEETIKPKKGDLLFSRANTKELVAATCIVDKDYDDLFLPDKLWKINLNIKKVHPIFFKYVLSHRSFRNKLSEKATGTSGSMFNISKEKLCEFDFPIPPLELQQKFASIIVDTEALRQKQKQNEAELENLFQALLQKYFS